jgi:hypothetical protein
LHAARCGAEDWRPRLGKILAVGGKGLEARIPGLRADYLKAEGDANRGPKFEQLALALDHKRLSGSPPTESEMVQTRVGLGSQKGRKTVERVSTSDPLFSSARASLRLPYAGLLQINGMLT